MLQAAPNLCVTPRHHFFSSLILRKKNYMKNKIVTALLLIGLAAPAVHAAELNIAVQKIPETLILS